MMESVADFLTVRVLTASQGQMFETINKNYKDFVQTYNYAMDLETEVSSLSTELETLTNKVKVVVTTVERSGDSTLGWDPEQARQVSNRAAFTCTAAAVHPPHHLSAGPPLQGACGYWKLTHPRLQVNEQLDAYSKSIDQGEILQAASAVTAAVRTCTCLSSHPL